MEEENDSSGSEDAEFQDVVEEILEENPDENSDDSEDLWSDMAVAGPSEQTVRDSKTGLPFVTFNQTLPAQHQYLGGDLEEVEGGHVWEEERSVVDGMPLLALPGVILAPAQTLPLHSLHPRHVSMFRSIISKNKTFGVVNMNKLEVENGYELATIGTVAQVMAFKELTEQEMTTLTLRAIGRQRFRLLSTTRGIDGTLFGKIAILPEIRLPNPLHCTGFSRHARFHRGKSRNQNERGKWIYPALTGVPAFVMKEFDEEEIVDKMMKELCQWYEPEKVAKLARNRTGLSHWVAGNLPLSDENKLLLLATDCSTQRLRLELALMRQYSQLCCARCEILVGEKSDIFSMSVDGPMGAYVNPHGYVHEMITLLKTSNIESISRPTCENSWFPSYAWEILECQQCQSHMGWRFSTKKKDLKPAHFWGITRSSIAPKMKDESLCEAPKLPFPLGHRLSAALARLNPR